MASFKENEQSFIMVEPPSLKLSLRNFIVHRIQQKLRKSMSVSFTLFYLLRNIVKRLNFMAALK